MIRNAIYKLVRFIASYISPLMNLIGRKDSAVEQLILMNQYKFLNNQGLLDITNISETGFKIYSQFDEDGILLFIFSLLKPRNKICVEIGAGDGLECNTTNLILNHGWWGYLFDGNPSNVTAGKAFFRRHRATFLHPPSFENAWVTSENVNELLRNSGVTGSVDLLSIDVDGMDYWIWEAITEIDPSVVVIESHNPVPPDIAITVPYDPTFRSVDADYQGASLLALSNLASSKGYRLIGCHKYGFNAFFIKNNLCTDIFKTCDVESCVQDPFSRKARASRWPKVKSRPWTQV